VKIASSTTTQVRKHALSFRTIVFQLVLVLCAAIFRALLVPFSVCLYVWRARSGVLGGDGMSSSGGDGQASDAFNGDDGQASDTCDDDDGQASDASDDDDDGLASDAFDDDDDELRVKLAVRRFLNDETEEAICRSSHETPAACGASSSRETATDEQSRLRPRQLLGGTPLDHDEDALSHLMGVMGMRLLMIGAAVSKPWRNAARARLGAWRMLSHERVVGAAKLARPLFGAPLPDGGIIVSESSGARLKVP